MYPQKAKRLLGYFFLLKNQDDHLKIKESFPLENEPDPVFYFRRYQKRYHSQFQNNDELIYLGCQPSSSIRYEDSLI